MSPMGHVCALARELAERRVYLGELLEATNERARALGILVVQPMPGREETILAALDALDDLDGVPWPAPAPKTKRARPAPQVEVLRRRAR